LTVVAFDKESCAVKKENVEEYTSVTEVAHKLGLYSKKLGSTHVRDHFGGRVSFSVRAYADMYNNPAFELEIGPDASGDTVSFGLESDAMEKLMRYFGRLNKHALSQQKRLAERYCELSRLVDRKFTKDDTID
jgi:hypothetical protein